MKSRRSIEKPVAKFISSGSSVLNLALSGGVDGGWRIGRVVNIVGDKSTGKTLLALEAANYVLRVLGKSESVRVIYDETEAAFDMSYAKSLNILVEEMEFKQSATVEDWFFSLEKLLDEKDDTLTLYILDSLDALSSNREAKTAIDKEAGFGTKAAKMGELFRKLVGKVRKKRMLILIVSQVRDNIGVTFGRKYKRSGGKALDFFASQVVWLAEAGKIDIADEAVGVNIKAKVEKNKIAHPYRSALFPILFDSGVDNTGGVVDYLVEKGEIKKSGTRLEWKENKFYRNELILNIEESNSEQELITLVSDIWKKAEEERFNKTRRKPKYA